MGNADWRQGSLGPVAHGRESVDLNIMEEILSSKQIWFMFERDYSDWFVVVARVAAGRLVEAVPLGEMTLAES